MGYKTDFQEQTEVKYQEFIKSVEELEKQITPEVSKYIQGKVVFVLLNDNYQTTYFENTTVSDLHAVEGDLNIDCLVQSDGWENLELISIREPKKKDFRGKIKFTPPNTLSVSCRMFAPDDKSGKMAVCGWDKLPFLQDEKFVKAFCEEAYGKDEEGTDYNYLEKHAFRALANDRRFKCGNDWELTSKTAEPDMSQLLHRIICQAFDFMNSWGVVYEYAGSEFIFPMPREHIQSIFKDRDKENGRRPVIASVVRTYQRKDGTTVDGHLRTADGFSIGGRDFSIFIGSEDFEKIFPKTEKSFKRAAKMTKGISQIGGTKFGYASRKS